MRSGFRAAIASRLGSCSVPTSAYAWVNRTAAKWLAAFGVERSTDEIYARMNELAAAIRENDDTLVCAPLFRGTRWKPAARGDFHFSVTMFGVLATKLS